MQEGSESISPHIHEVSNTEIAERMKNELGRDFAELGKVKFSHRFDHGLIDTHRKGILQKVGGVGEDAARDLFPFLREKYLEDAHHSPDKSGYYDLTLVNDALATDSPDDIQRSLDILDQVRDGSLTSGGMNYLLYSREQICYTLTRQISELQERDPDSQELAEARQRLLEVRNDPFTDDLMKDKLLRIPLAAAGDPDANAELGTIRDIEVGKYDHRQFDLDKLQFVTKERKNPQQQESTQSHQSVDPAEQKQIQDAKIEDIQKEIREITSENDDISDDERVKREILERLRTPQSINSYDSTYHSNLQYEIPDPDALWHHITSGEHKQNMVQYYRDHGVPYPIGPAIGENGKYPVLYYDENNKSIELRLPVPIPAGKDFSKLFVPEFISKFKATAGDRLSDSSVFTVDTGRGSHNTLMRSTNGGRGGYGIASLNNGELVIHVSNLGRFNEPGIRDVEDFRIAMQNALDLHRVLSTEYFNEENVVRNRQGKELVEIPHETVVIDHRADMFESAEIPKAA